MFLSIVIAVGHLSLVVQNSLVYKSRAFDLGRPSPVVLDWLRNEFDTIKPTQKLADLAALDADGLVAEVKKIRGRAQPLRVADVKRQKAEHGQSVEPLQALAREAAALERRVSDLVNEAYGLTPDEVALLWQTAPPWMPVGPG